VAHGRTPFRPTTLKPICEEPKAQRLSAVYVSEPVRQPVYVFEGFRLDAQRRVLFGTDGQPIPLTPRIFDTLLYFVERAGQLLTKEQLMEAIWPRVVVEEHNLNKTVSELRRVLGEKPGQHKFIVTKPGAGYRFVADVSIETRAADAGAGKHEHDSVIDRAGSPARWAGRVGGSKLGVVATGLAAAALVFVATQAYLGGRWSIAGQKRDALPAVDRSVAVLPFVDLSEDGTQTWLADGLAEEILNSLAQIPEVKVTARTSSFKFRDEGRDIREIGERLGVANVLEGTVASAGADLRVTAQLIRAADGFQLWSNRYGARRAICSRFSATLLNVWLPRWISCSTRPAERLCSRVARKASTRSASIKRGGESTTSCILVRRSKHSGMPIGTSSVRCSSTASSLWPRSVGRTRSCIFWCNRQFRS